MNVQHVDPIRRWLYEAADALDSWEDQSSAAAIRSAAELLGSGEVVRRLRFVALVRAARDLEATDA